MVETITIRDGLAHACIQYILQDKDGFMWFATEGGLNRYDGYNIKLYKTNDEFISTIYEDPADSGKALWIGTRDGGLQKFDKESEKFIRYQHIPDDLTSLSHNNVTCIYKDKLGIFWIGTYEGGLNRFDECHGEFSAFQFNPNDPNSIRSDRVFAICEDSHDNLWIGTIGGGLELLDRKTGKFKHYAFDPDDPHTLPSNEIYSLLNDHQQTLWIGTGNGVFKYDLNSDRFVRHKFIDRSAPNLNYGLIYSITEDHEKTLWIASQAVGIVGLPRNRQKFLHFSYNPGKENTLISGVVSHVCRDCSGVIWVGTFCKGINKICPLRKPFKHYRRIADASGSLTNDWIFSLFEDEDQNLWVGTSGGLHKFKNERFKHFRFDNWFYDNIYGINQSSSGKLWLARGRCLTEFDPVTEKYTNFFGKHKIYSPEIFSMVDSLKKVQSEIASIDQVTNNRYIQEEFAIEKPGDVLIVAMGEGSYSNLVDYGWITSKNSRDTLWKMDPEKTKYAGGSWQNRVQISIISISPGDYELNYRSNATHGYDQWVETPPTNVELWGIQVFKLVSLAKGKYQSILDIPTYQNMHWNDLNIVQEDKSGRLWCNLTTMANGLHYFDRDRKELIPCQLAAERHTFTKLHGFYKDKDDDMWFYSPDNKLIRKASSDDIEMIDIGRQLVSMKYDSVDNNNVSTFRQDSQGLLWVGTEAGLIKYNKETKTIAFFDPENFVSPNNIMGILEDDKDNLWMSTTRNLVKYNPNQNTIKMFDQDDGLPDIQFSVNCCVKRRNGQLVFGGTNGFISFNTDSITLNQHKPPVVFTDFRLFDRSIQPGEKSPLKKAISQTDQIVLNYNQNTFSLEFAVLDFTAPNQNEYAYKLEGVNPDWVFTDASRRYVTYTTLRPGRYTFRVKATNNDGIWNEQGASIRIIIDPPFWQTTWFKIFFGLLFLSLLILTVRYFATRKLKLKLQELEYQRKLDEERERISKDMHDEVGSSLTRIAILSELAKKEIPAEYEGKEYIDDISETSREVVDNIGEIIWAINPQNDLLENLIAYTRQYVSKYFEATSTRCVFDLPEKAPAASLSAEFRRNIFLVTKEAVTNIVKHACASEVLIHIQLKNNLMIIEITDNGKGFCLEKKSQFGNGLNNMKHRIEQLKGKWKINSVPGEGTRIEVAVKF